MVKKYEDMFTGFDAIDKRDRHPHRPIVRHRIA